MKRTQKLLKTCVKVVGSFRENNNKPSFVFYEPSSSSGSSTSLVQQLVGGGSLKYFHSSTIIRSLFNNDDDSKVTGNQPISSGGDDAATPTRIASTKENKLELANSEQLVNNASLSKKKGLGVNGRVYVDQYIYIAQESMKEKLQESIDYGEFCTLIAPGQSGKTSLVRNTLMPSLEQGGYLPVFVDMRGVVRTYLFEQFKTTKKGFHEALMVYINRFFNTNYKPPLGITSIFAHNSCIPEFKEKKVVLLLDEIDSIVEIPLEERNRFLTGLSAMKHNKELYCLYSCLAITNCVVGEYFGQTIGKTPFNATNTIYGDYFSKKEIELFFNEYEKESHKKIGSEIRNYIYKLTTGAQGQTVMLTKHYDTLCGGEKASIDEQHWQSSLISFLSTISTYHNFMGMESVVKDEAIAKSLLNWYKDNMTPSNEILDTLIKSNILRRAIDKDNFGLELIFASPLVQKYVMDRLTRIECEPLEDLPILQNGNIDFVKLLPLIIKSMDRMSVVIGCDTQHNHVTSAYPDGPKEILYQTAFNEAIKTILNKFNVTIKDDNVITIGHRYTIVVEHCANVSMSHEKEDRNTLKYHVTKANNYSTGVKPTVKDEKRQTVVLHWTTVPNTDKFEYQFPECKDSVSVIHIYHDALFSKVEIVTNDSTLSIDLSSNIGSSTSTTTTTRLQRSKGTFETNGIQFNKDDCTEWLPSNINLLLTSSKSKNGIGLNQQRIENMDIEGVDFENIIDALIRFNGDETAKIEHASNEILHVVGDVRVRKSITRWVFNTLLEYK